MGEVEGGGVVTVNDRPSGGFLELDLRVTSDILSAGRMPKGLRQEMPVVTFHSLSRAPTRYSAAKDLSK